MEGLGFWIFFGIIALAIIWTSSRERIEKQRTLQRLLERNEEVDEALVDRVLGARTPARPGDTYRTLRAMGVCVMVASIPVGVFVVMAAAGPDESALIPAIAGLMGWFVTFVTGLAFLFAAKFSERPGQIPEPGKSGGDYRALRPFGAFVMVVSVPLGVCAAMIFEILAVGMAVLLVTLLAGLGIFLAPKYLARPIQNSEEA